MGNASQPGDLQAIALTCRALVYRMQEHDTVFVLGGCQMYVNRMFKLVSQLCQLEVMSRKKGVAADLPGQVLCGGPGQRQPIKGAGAPAHLVHQYQAVGRSEEHTS